MREWRRGGARTMAAALVAATMGGLGGATTSGEAWAQGTRAVPGRVVSRHGAWIVVCDTPPGAEREQCGATQSVVSEQRPDLGIDVTVFETADRAARILRVLTPLGVFLPAGLGLDLDGEDLGRAVFTRCVAGGCEANVVMDEALLSRLRRGTRATFIVFQTPETGTGFPVDLEGLDEAYAALEASRDASEPSRDASEPGPDGAADADTGGEAGGDEAGGDEAGGGETGTGDDPDAANGGGTANGGSDDASEGTATDQ